MPRGSKKMVARKKPRRQIRRPTVVDPPLPDVPVSLDSPEIRMAHALARQQLFDQRPQRSR